MNSIIQYLIFFVRIVLACICGGLVGYERKNRGKGAGIRTHSIVAIASALMMIVSKYCFTDVADYPGLRGADPARIAAQVVSGVGFLGAGMIYFNHHTVRGLTTAAGVWATAGIGLALGSGMYALGIFTTVLIVGFQILLHKGEGIFNMPNSETINVVINDNAETFDFIKNTFERLGILVEGTNLKRMADNKVELGLSVNIPSNLDYSDILNTFKDNKDIYEIDI